MIPNAAAQHRGKHFDLLLTRELALIEREHEQNLIIHKKLERSILWDNNQRIKLHRKKISITNKEPVVNGQNEKSDSSVVSSTIITQTQVDETLPHISPRFHRNCMKGQRLPPLIKSNRKKRRNNDTHWMPDLESTHSQKEDASEIFTVVTEELPKVSLPELTPMQKQIRSFMETLPTYKGLHRGFDNFAPASLHSRRAPVAMR